MDGVRAATAHNEFWKRAGKQNLPASSVDLFYFGVSSSSVSAGAQSENPTTSRVARVIILIISAQICAKNLRVSPEWQKCVEKCTQVAGGGGDREGAGVLIHRSADSAFIFCRESAFARHQKLPGLLLPGDFILFICICTQAHARRPLDA